MSIGYEHITINTSQLPQVARMLWEADEPLLLMGNYGIGKTEILEEFASSIDAKLTSFTGADQSFFDIQMPYIESETVNEKQIMRTAYAVSRRIPIEDGKRHVIFADEINNLPPSAQIVMYGMMLRKQVGDVKLPKNTFCIGAGNRIMDKCNAQEMSAALKDRFGCVYNLVPHTEGWVRWASHHNIPPEVISFAINYPGCLTGQDPADPCGGCSPRSLSKLSKLLTNGIIPSLEPQTFMGSIGQKWGSQFIGHIDMFRKEISIDKLMEDPKSYPVPKQLSTQYGIICALSQRSTSSNMSHILHFITKLSTTMQLVYWKLTGMKDPELITNNKDMVSFVTANQEVIL